MNKCYYVIEGSGVFWCGHGMNDFQPLWSDEVVRFARRVDAERILHWLLHEAYRRTCQVVEHKDMESFV